MTSRARKIHGAKAILGNPDQWRRRIEASKLINRLQGHANGDVEMSQTQVKAADILLRKVLPDQTESKVEHSGNVTVEIVQFTGTPAK